MGKSWTRNQKILLGTLLVVVAGSLIVPFVLHFLKKPEGKITNIEGDVSAIGDHANVTVDKGTGVDVNVVFNRAMMAAEAKGRAEFQVEQLNEELAKAVKRVEELDLSAASEAPQGKGTRRAP